MAPVVRFLGLDRVLRTGWFLAALLVSSVTLSLVVHGQWQRARILLKQSLSLGSFRGAPFAREWVRPSGGTSGAVRSQLQTTGRWSLLGLPLFHTGLLILVLAGFISLLCRVGASVDLFEGETLPANSPAAFGAQSPGLLRQSLALPCPVTLEKLEPERYASSAVKAVTARVRLGDGCDSGERSVAINSPLGVGPSTLYLTNMHGPAAFVQTDVGGRSDKQVALLRDEGTEGHTATMTLPDDLEARLRAGVDGSGALPGRVELRILRAGGLLFVGNLAAGQAVDLPGGASVALIRIGYWARFTASSDPSTWFAYAGFLLCVIGAALAVCVVRVDSAVVVTPVDGGERVFVALKPARFAPLYAERFEQLVNELDGPEATA